MKILHTADWHLGAYVGQQCDDPLQRMENTLKCLDVLIETAEKEKTDLILIAGDIFHTAKVWSDRANVEIRWAAACINKLQKIAPTVVLYGTPNHDNLEQFLTLKELTDAIFICDPRIDTISTVSGPIQVAGLPGFDKGFFRAQYPGLSAEEENRIFTEQLDNIVQGLSAQIDPNIPSVLMAHHTVVGCKLDNGQHVFQQNDVVLSAATLENSSFDMVCLGHIHRAQSVGEVSKKPIFYSGSMDAFTFNDEEHIKGFWIHTLPHHPSGHKFIETPAREFFTINWDDVTLQQWNANGWLAFDLTQEPFKNKVVRVLYTCDKATEKALDKKKLERDLYAAGTYYVSEIRPEKVTAEVNKEKLHERLTVWECLKNHLKEKYKDEESEGILTEAEAIVSEVEASSPAGSQTGMFLPLEIEVRNYRSYAEEKLSFEDLCFCMVNGKNGSGKSSLVMDAIVDCLYEEPREGELTGWIKSGERSGSMSFTFLLGADTYRVTRTRQRSGKATLSIAKLEALGGGISYNPEFPLNWEDISCQKLVDTQQKIIQLLSMDADTFRSCVLIMQDQYGRFMEAKSEDRMSVLASLLGLGIYEQLEDKTKKLLTDINRELKQAKDEVSELECEVSTMEGLQNQKTDTEESLQEEQSALIILKKDRTDIADKVAVYNLNKKKLEELSSEVQKKDAAIIDTTKRINDLESDIFETKEFLGLEDYYQGRHNEFLQTKEQISSMDGTVRLLEDKRKSFSEVEENISQSMQTLKKYKSEFDEINIRLGNYISIQAEIQRLDGVENELKTQEEKKAAADNLTRKIIEINGQLAKVNNSIRIYEQQTVILKNANCIDIKNAQCGFLKNAKDAEIKLKQLEQTKLQITDELTKLETDKTQLAYDEAYHAVVKGYYNDYQRYKNQLATLDGEKKSADMYEKRIAELETSQDKFIHQSGLFNNEIIELSQKTEGLSALEARVAELEPDEKSYQDITKAKVYLEAVEPQLEELKNKLFELIPEKSELEKEYCWTKSEVDGFQENIDLLKLLDSEIIVKESKISELNRTLGSLDEKLKLLDGKVIKLQDKQSGIKSLATKSYRLQVLSEAFSQDGIPHQIVRDIVPELEESANAILSQMTGGRMSLEFRTEKNLKSNKDKEIPVLDVMITDIDNGELPYLSRSGGQKTRCSLSVIFALAILKASRMGLQLGMLFIDEPAGLDEEGINGYCTALETIHALYPEMRIVAISHDERMKARFAQHLFVETTENGSKVRKS